MSIIRKFCIFVLFFLIINSLSWERSERTHRDEPREKHRREEKREDFEKEREREKRRERKEEKLAKQEERQYRVCFIYFLLGNWNELITALF